VGGGCAAPGEDFVRNLGIAALDYANIHVYPHQWGILPSDLGYLTHGFIADRAALAHAAGKPIVLEEYGCAKRKRWQSICCVCYESQANIGHAEGAVG
jgi:endo-1,4-beta-mannosidase